VRLQSEVGRGSTFTLLLPLHEPSPAPRGENS
jgi:signal transduction histidine kinase